MELERVNILGVAKGAISERLDYELGKVVANIKDMTTKPDAVRKISITVSLKPDSERQGIKMSTQVKSTLVPTNNIESALYLTEDDGKSALVEMMPQIPGQVNIDGEVEASPKVINIKEAM